MQIHNIYFFTVSEQLADSNMWVRPLNLNFVGVKQKSVHHHSRSNRSHNVFVSPSEVWLVPKPRPSIGCYLPNQVELLSTLWLVFDNLLTVFWWLPLRSTKKIHARENWSEKKTRAQRVAQKKVLAYEKKIIPAREMLTKKFVQVENSLPSSYLFLRSVPNVELDISAFHTSFTLIGQLSWKLSNDAKRCQRFVKK